MRLVAPAVLSMVVVTMACSQPGGSGPTATSPSVVSNGGADLMTARPDGPARSVASHDSAVVQFGKPNVGSGFPPAPSPHDQSAHAVDDMVPRTVVIDVGGTVTFNTLGVHQIAIYAPGTTPDDIDTSILVPTPAGCPKPGGAPLLIDDPENRVALLTRSCPAPVPLHYKFEKPGRYLVICAFLPHFQVQMWGWVEVRDR